MSWVSGIATAFTWQRWVDILPVVAMVLGTVGMFLLRGIAMRTLLGLAALAWMLNRLIIGTIGGTLAEGLIVATHLITIVRLLRARQKYLEVFDDREAEIRENRGTKR